MDLLDTDTLIRVYHSSGVAKSLKKPLRRWWCTFCCVLLLRYHLATTLGGCNFHDHWTFFFFSGSDLEKYRVYAAPPTSYFPLPPSLVPCSQWEKGECIGSGSFGHVYLGFNSEHGQFCAIKEVRVLLDDPHSKEQLKQLNLEIDLLSQLSHPNIVQYYGSNLTDGALSIYLEYVFEGSIHKLLSEYGPFKESTIRYFTAQILSGIAYLHEGRTVHRDIKGANILVGHYGEVKLADFGLAKHISSVAEIHSIKGTAYWMAPELIKSSYSGEGYNLSVDIWSLGCTLIEMATARPPWHPLEPVAAMFKIANSKDTPKIPDSFSEIGKSFLRLCLKRDPASRPSAAGLMGHPFVEEYRSPVRASIIELMKDER